MTDPEKEKNAKSSLIRLAGLISKRVQIQGIALVESRVRRNAEGAELPESIRLTYGFKTDYSYSQESKELSVLVALLVGGTATDDDEEKEDGVFRFEASFAVSYEVTGDEPCDEESIKAFARMNGIYNVWPYWREYAQSTAGRMGLPPLTVPVLTGQAIEKMIRSQEAPASPESPSDIAAPGEKSEVPDKK